MDNMILLPDSQEDKPTTWNTNSDSVWSSKGIPENDKTLYTAFIRKLEDIDLFTVSVGDTVFISPSAIGKIIKMWEDEEEQQVAQVTMYFRPRQTAQGEKPFHGKAELIPSNIKVVIPLQGIQGMVNNYFFIFLCTDPKTNIFFLK